jgi:hypothetical protein
VGELVDELATGLAARRAAGDFSRI